MRASRLLRSSTVLAASCSLALIAVVGTTVAGSKAASAASSIGGQISTSEVMARAQNWVDRAPAYSQTSYFSDLGNTRSYRQDCSGFVDMAWHLGSDPDTDGLTSSSLTSKQVNQGDVSSFTYANIRPGDIFDDLVGPHSHHHVFLFEAWESDHQHFSYFNFGGGASGTAPPEHHTHALFSDSTVGYEPTSEYTVYRYLNIVDNSEAPALSAGEFADVDGDGLGDVMATRPDGSMWLYHGDGSLTYPFSSGVQIGQSGWQGFDRIAIGDVDGDHKADLVATKPDGTMWLYHGDGSLTYPFSSGVQIGASGWQGYNRFALGDVDGDGKADLIATKSDGTMWLLHGDGSLTYPFSSAVQIGAGGWQSFDRVQVGDVNGDHKADLIATKPDGTMWLYHGDGSLTYPFSSGVQIGQSGWQNYDRLL